MKHSPEELEAEIGDLLLLEDNVGYSLWNSWELSAGGEEYIEDGEELLPGGSYLALVIEVERFEGREEDLKAFENLNKVPPEDGYRVLVSNGMIGWIGAWSSRRGVRKLT